MGKMNKFVRWLYGAIGALGLAMIGWVFTHLEEFKVMGWFANVSFIVAVIAMVNWGIVAVTGKRDKDLFGLIGL